jgi:hypothetical protein
MKTAIRTALLLIIISSAFTSCKSYEVMHYKNNELDKVGKLTDYTVYVHDKGKTFKMNNPSSSPAGVSGGLTQITDPDKAKEIRNPNTPGEIRKHKHDLNLFTKTDIGDSAKTVALKRDEITDVSITVSKSGINWTDIGNGVATVLVCMVCIASIAGIVYAFQQHG